MNVFLVISVLKQFGRGKRQLHYHKTTLYLINKYCYYVIENYTSVINFLVTIVNGFIAERVETVNVTLFSCFKYFLTNSNQINFDFTSLITIVLFFSFIQEY